MAENNTFQTELFDGLKALAATAFPKKCANCGRVFETSEQFLRETENINEARTGLKEAEEEDGSKIIEAFRNCPCGSTLMDFFGDRRDNSDAGNKRRQKFEQVLVFLEDNGLERAVARLELLKMMRGEKSEILTNIRPPKI